PSQVISSRAALRNLSPGCAPGSTSNCVIIRPAAGQTVTINGTLEIHGSSLYVQGTPSSSFSGVPSRNRSYTMKVTGYVDTESDSGTVYPDHVIVEGTDSTSFGIFDADTVTFKNMDVGPATV